MYWSLCILVGQLTSFLAVFTLSVSRHENGDDVVSVGTNDLWRLLGFIDLGFVVSFAIFARHINKGYINTFFTTMTGSAFCISKFRDATSDVAKFEIFTIHRSYYEPIIDEVKVWLGGGWHEWNCDAEWFTNEIKATVPLDLIPDDEEEDSTDSSS